MKTDDFHASVIEEFAPAKINLTLHVTGQRADGYHLLDSLVVFADLGDRITVRGANQLKFQVIGPMAEGVPVDSTNLVLKAAGYAGVTTADITLEKNLPAAAGIGGGSADAAALLRALQQNHDCKVPDPDDVLSLGADVPVCLRGQTARMLGIGDQMEDVKPVPALPSVLVNPGVPVSTPQVFSALERKDMAGMAEYPGFADVRACCIWLAAQRNDLEVPAIRLAPEIGEVLEALRSSGALLARMSGSGATCFGVYDTMDAAISAARVLSANTGWWVRPSLLAA